MTVVRPNIGHAFPIMMANGTLKSSFGKKETVIKQLFLSLNILDSDGLKLTVKPEPEEERAGDYLRRSNRTT
jgi:hypothetical protein